MPLMDPVIKAWCDKCQDESDEIGLTVTARGYDERNVVRDLKKLGWKVAGDTTLCPNCHDGTDADQ